MTDQVTVTRAAVATRWRALGTFVYLATDHPATTRHAAALAHEILDAVDSTCSRFRADSDLSRANASPGHWVEVDPLLAAAAAVALEAARATDGLVDPCLGRPMVTLGYDRTFAELGSAAPHRVGPSEAPHDPDAWRQLEVDPGGAVRVPPGCSLDLGATAKAWASDLVATAVADALGCRVVVSLGGDVRIAGPTGAGPWPVEVSERPGQPGETVLLADGGLATSSTQVRRWRTSRGDCHHVLDPRTASPVRSVWRTASATGPTCVAANVATTAALVLGGEAVAWLEQRDVAARLVDGSGAVLRLGGWPHPSSSPETP
ncbi:MAG TPA: FAD:protein FMN transferase [Nocardioides sp.]|nr:FAD:protein FMN transferase [Nocardioides sp.]